LNLSCDVDGKCSCRDNIAGDKCDRCVDNHFNFELGCQKCDECYSLVESKIISLKNDLISINNNFENKIKQTHTDETKRNNLELEKTLLKLKNEIKSVHDELYNKSICF
jgi:hypothetical protein